jgi:UDP:flavonoid glycosyltransferase YjiC (YdhE family)
MARPAKPLPEDFQNFLDEANDGAILMSLGSVLNFFPQDMIDMFCEVFSKLEQRVIWRLPANKQCSDGASNNVMVVTWTPQNDVLAHRNMKLFITHAGLNSVVESIYHKVPMVVIPVMFDQPANAIKLLHKHLAVQLKIAELEVDDVEAKIRSVLNNETFIEALSRASAILREKLESTGKRASFWIRHVVQHGDSHLRTSAYDLNILQFLMVDVVAFLLAISLLFLFVGYKSARCCCRCCCSRRKKPKTD